MPPVSLDDSDIDKLIAKFRNIDNAIIVMSDPKKAARVLRVSNPPTKSLKISGLPPESRSKVQQAVSSSKGGVDTTIVTAVAEVFYGGLMIEVNNNLNPERALNLERVKRDADEDKKKAAVTIGYTGGKRVSFERLPHKTKYRNPDRARPYNFHWGAARKFRRFGVVQLTVPPGKTVAAGYKKVGRPYAGLGFEPIGIKPKDNAHISKYRVFVRVAYPKRLHPHSKDTVTLKHRFPIYTEVLAIRASFDTIQDRMISVSEQLLSMWKDQVQFIIISSFKK